MERWGVEGIAVARCNAKSTALRLATDLLRREGYHKIQALPLRRKTFSPLLMGHELGTLIRFAQGRRNTFGVSLRPALYLKFYEVLRPTQVLLYRLFFLNTRVPMKLIAERLGREAIDILLKSGLLRRGSDGDTCFSPVRVVPYRYDLYLTDPWDRSIEGMAYLSYDSLFLADWVRGRSSKRIFERGLDLCTGVGVVACAISPFCKAIVATDVNSSAIQYAQTNARLNGFKNIKFATTDLFQEVRGRFDLIVCNPPFVFMPDSLQTRMQDSYGGHLGIEVTLRVLQGLEQHSSAKGRAIVLSRAPFVGKEDALLRRVDDIFKGSKWKVMYTDICACVPHDELRDFYRTHGVSTFRMVVIDVERAAAYSLEHRSELLGSVRYQF